jgi:chitosanase
MLKQHINRITKVVTILLAVFLVVSLTVGAASAIGSLPAKAAIMQQYFTCENNQVVPDWNYAENINDGRGITFGFIGFTTGTYDGNIVIHQYTTMNPNNVLAKYIPALDAIDAGPHNSDADHDGNPSVVGLGNFIQDVNSINDPLWAQAQLGLFNSMYWNIAVKQANSIGAQYEVTLGVIFDANGRHGEDGAQSLIDQTTSAMGGTPKTGVNEIAWLNKFIQIRDAKLNSEHLGDQDRQNGWKEDIAAGNYNLVTPYVIHTYGDPYTIDGILGVDLGGGVGLGPGGNGGGTTTPVKAIFTASPNPVNVGNSVHFDASASTGTGLTYVWKLTDSKGTVTTIGNGAASFNQPFTAVGSYTVKLTETDSASKSDVTQTTITVGAAPSSVNSPTPKLTLSKSASPTTYNKAGQVITYTYTVKNTGNVPISSIAVSDSKVTRAINIGDLAPGTSVTKTAKYTITRADISAGSVSNTASATGYFGTKEVTSNTVTKTVRHRR